jgi:threonine aldolase
MSNMSANKIIDLRSDTVTRPTPAMRKAMSEAEVGDDVYGDDPTVIKLQEYAANMLGTEAALFLPTGTQSNLCALLSHCERGDEYIVGQRAHTYMYEGGGGAVFASIQPQPLDFMPDGTLDLAQVAACVKPDDPHFAKTRLLCLENTTDGKVLPLDYLAETRSVADRFGLATHLDGARVFNASVKLNVPITDITRHFDSISFCLSKGLCSPAGSILCGTSELIGKAHRWRKMLGGGMRQSGILAAAGILSLTEQIQHLDQDHQNALQLANTLADVDGLTVDPNNVQTNMLFVGVDKVPVAALRQEMEKDGILISGRTETIRLVTHFDIKNNDIDRITTAFARSVEAL